MRISRCVTGVSALFYLSAILLSQEEKQPPVSIENLLQVLSSPEAERPSEEVVNNIRKLSTDFELTPEVEVRIRRSAESAGRPADLVRQVVLAAKENWILDRIRLLSRKKEGIPQIAGMVRERGVKIPYSQEYEASLLAAGADEPVLTLLWPPLEPLKPRFRFQAWRVPRQNVDPLPVVYDPSQARGEVEIDAVVDGRVMFVLKHDTVFYNVICGADLQLTKAHFSGPVPHLSADRIDYRVDISRKKPRGHVFACPQDKQCLEAANDRNKKKAESLCSWEDLPDSVDEHGFSNVRFVIDDHQSGAAAYSVGLQWAVRPYTLEWFAADLRKYGTSIARQRAYNWGVAFGNDAKTEEALRAAGAGENAYEQFGLGRIVRGSNMQVPKIH